MGPANVFFLGSQPVRDASPFVCQPHLFYFILLLSLFPSSFIFVSLCGVFVVLVLVFLSGLFCAASMIAFLPQPSENDIFLALDVF